MATKLLRVGFIGAGAMSFSIAKGLLDNKHLSQSLYGVSKLSLSDISSERMNFIKKQFASYKTPVQTFVKDNRQVAEQSDIVILAVKPKHAFEALESVKDILEKSNGTKILVPICAGLKSESYYKIVNNNVHIVRIMPNVNCFTGESASAMALSNSATGEDAAKVKFLFKCVGTVSLVEEDLMDAVTGLSGSGPAYVYLFIESLADGGVRSGLSRDIAMELAVQTVFGSAKMLKQELLKGSEGKHPGQLKDMVCSPAGTTIAGVSSLEDDKFRGIVMNAVFNAAKRSRELGSKL